MKKTRDKLAQYLGLRIRLLKLHISLHKATIFFKKKKKKRVDKCHHPVRHLFSN